MKDVGKITNGDIFFVGDSFCNCFHIDSKRGPWPPHWQYGVTTTNLLHPSLVADYFDYKLHVHGYGGKSWWYSRCKFFSDLEKCRTNPKQTFDLKAVIFFHSDPWRINNSWNDSLNQTRQFDEPEKTYYYKNILDPDFQQWCQAQWYHEIAREFGDELKTLHFFCFPKSMRNSDCLPGMVFDNISMIEISIAELTGSREEINRMMSIEEQRFNHLSGVNNRALAEFIIQSIENYNPGRHCIDLDKFDMPNKNYKNWPNGNFGTT